MRKIKKYHYALLILILAGWFGNLMCTTQKNAKATADAVIRDGYDKAFAGSASCVSCHKTIYESHIRTAHYRDSRPADSRAAIKGSFDSGRNRFVYNKFMEVILEKKGNQFWQTGYIGGDLYQREAFGVVIGSGRKGQTYLYWKDSKLFQLPVSYYTPLDDWCNSPGYSTNLIRFDRQITPHCIECHGTYAKAEDRNSTGDGYLFDKTQIIYGIDCEKCHGPGAEHVAFHKANPGEKNGKFIIHATLLTRQQRLDACALCHSGVRDELKPAFSFKVGDKLDEFSMPAYSSDSVATLDVHGNQYGLLTSSKCFRMSQMDCSSCHNVHRNEVNSPKLYSERCMTCHQTAAHNSCTMPVTAGLVLAINCIDCHMPALPSQKIFLQLSNASKTTPDLVRTHRVAIYPESTKAYLEKLRG
ncbi:MAG: multiheme c-type cytochrome [Bacteroidota bacterium]|nr:multiheme c-type cytochrome [Bacteroidota bacterium]